MQTAMTFQKGKLVKNLESMFKHFDLVIKVLGIYPKKKYRDFHKKFMNDGVYC